MDSMHCHLNDWKWYLIKAFLSHEHITPFLVTNHIPGCDLMVFLDQSAFSTQPVSIPTHTTFPNFVSYALINLVVV